jgi:putative ATP-dependent endonuclease of OLD family
MKIKEIKISNILSFGLKPDFETSAADIEFGKDLNVIVGANGSGKSNFVEIIFTVFQSYFLEQYAYNYAFEQSLPDNPRYITKRNDGGNDLRLNKHINSEDKDSHLYLNITLGDTDRKNLDFIKANIEKLEELSKKYIAGDLVFKNFPFLTIDMSTVQEVGFKFVVKNNDKTHKVIFSLEEERGNKIQEVVNFYLKNFDLIRKLVDTGISKEGCEWQPLLVSFEFLGSHRRALSFPTNLDFTPGLDNQINNLVFQKKNTNIKNNADTSSIFGLTNAKVGNQIRKDNRNSRLTLEEAIDKQFTDENSLFYKLNELLKIYLGLSIRKKSNPSENNDTITIEIFKCGSGKVVEFDQLSSGQKSIFTLISLIVSSDLENGFLMVDEPELHLHPRLQKKYFNLLKDFSTKFGVQSILITHSPVFIDEKSIRNTYRFFITSEETKIIKPSGISSTDEELIKFLSYTNSSKIFFTNKVILVEGDSDSYFFTYLLNTHLATSEEIEFLAIGGKSAYKKWFDFLKKFEIQCYLVTDFDFLDSASCVDLKIKETREQIASVGLTPESVARATLLPTETNKIILDKYSEVVDGLLEKTLAEVNNDDLLAIQKAAFIKRQRKIKFSVVADQIEKDPVLKEKLENKISDLRTENIYVLRWGDLEGYLKIHNKNLQNIIDYCANDEFISMDEKYKKDLEGILANISRAL